MEGFELSQHPRLRRADGRIGRPDLVVIGASAGGVSAVQKILNSFQPVMRFPVVIIQHLAKSRKIDINNVYFCPDRRSVLEVEDKMSIEASTIYFAPPDYHLMFERDRTLALDQDTPLHFSRPSIDISFGSAAERYGAGVIGILLTGANEDGAAGLLAIHRAGGLTIVQDPLEAESSRMPRAALALFAPDAVLQIGQIGPCLNEISNSSFNRSEREN